MSETGCVETGFQKVVVVRHRLSESGCNKTGCQKLVMGRRGIEGGYGETGGQ